MAQTETLAVAANVRAEMARAGYSARELAQQVDGLTARTLSRRLIGDGPFRITELTAIAEVLGIPLAALLAGVAA